MSVTESVRHRLRLSRELLTGAASCAPMSDHPQRVACDLIISHDAATLALAAICQQLGRTPNKTRDSLLDYLVWDDLCRQGAQATRATDNQRGARCELARRY